MTQVAYLDIKNPNRRLYNDVVRKSLDNAGITYEQQSTYYGKRLLVKNEDASLAARVILGISLYNPKYPK